MMRMAKFGVAAVCASLALAAASAPALAWRRALPASVVHAPVVPDVGARAAYAPCSDYAPGCVYVAVSRARASCAIAAVSGHGYSSARYVAELRAAIARGCAAPSIATNLVSARF